MSNTLLLALSCSSYDVPIYYYVDVSTVGNVMKEYDEIAPYLDGAYTMVY